MLIIAGSPDINIQTFITLIRESSCEFDVEAFHTWQQYNTIPMGFIYIKVMPEITFKRLQQTNFQLTLEQIDITWNFLNDYFVNKIIMPKPLHSVPVLILNGFVDFEADFSQFYNHLFYIKKFFSEIKEKESREKGTYIAPKKHTGCKC